MTEPRPSGPPGLPQVEQALRLSLRAACGAVLVLLLIYAVRNSLFVVEQHETALVLRLGRIAGLGPQRLRKPGLHLAWPPPLDEIVRVPAARVRTVISTLHWPSDLPAPFESRSVDSAISPAVRDRFGYLLTGDANLVHAAWAVRYTLRDTEQFLFGVAEMDRLVRNELNRAVTLVAAAFQVDRLLRADKELTAAVAQVLRERFEKLDLRIIPDRVDILGLSPPRPALAAFEGVLRAEQERSEKIAAARMAAARITQEARARAAGRVARAEAEAVRRISGLGSEAAAFELMLDEYERRPLLLQLWRQAAIRRVLESVSQIYLVRPPGAGSQELRLWLGRPADSVIPEGEP